MNYEKLSLKLECKKKSNIEEITVDITLDKLGLWKEDLRRILVINKSQILSVSIVYTRKLLRNNGAFLNIEEKLFLEKV